MKNLENFKTQELSYDEMNDVNGGLIAIAAGIVIGAAIVAFGLGVYNGYKDAQN